MTTPTHWYPTAVQILANLDPEKAAWATPRTRPTVLGWHHAATKRPCPRCGDLIHTKDRVAHVDLDHTPAHICERCTR